MKCPLFDECENSCHDCEDIADDVENVSEVEKYAKENCFIPKDKSISRHVGGEIQRGYLDQEGGEYYE